MKNVYGYIRVSTAKQGEGVSLIAQKEAIERYAKQHDLNILQWFEEKETAAKQGRPLFMAMMKLLRNKKAAGVIIHKIDRSARNLKDWADIGNLIDQGVEMHFAHESLDLNARGGRLSADIQAVIAADFIRNQRQEVKKGLYGRLKQGIFPFQAPTGYLNHGKGKHKTIDPFQGPLVRLAFELYTTKKYTIETLTIHMQTLGLRNTKHKKVNMNTLSTILNNPFYMGIIRVKGVTFNGGHESLISPDLFARVQVILRNRNNRKVTKHEFKYRRLIKCTHCGYGLVGEYQKGNVYYRCHTKNCISKGMRETTLDNFLQKAFSVVQLKPEEFTTLETLLKEIDADWGTKQEELLRLIKLQKKNVEEKLERLTDCYVEQGLDKETFERRKLSLLAESKEKEMAQEEILNEKETILGTVQKFLERAKNLIESYKIGIFEEQRELIETVTSNLTVDGKKLILSMRTPFLELAERAELSNGAHLQGQRRINDSTFVFFDPSTKNARDFDKTGK